MLLGGWETPKSKRSYFSLKFIPDRSISTKGKSCFFSFLGAVLKGNLAGRSKCWTYNRKQYMIEIYDQFFGNLTELYELCSDESNSPTAIKPNTFVLRSKNSLLPYHSRPYRQIKTKIFKSSFQGHTNMIFL